MSKILIISLLIFFPLYVLAQQPTLDEGSVWVEGRVTDAITGLPQAVCEVQLLQDNDAKAVTLSDSGGYFTMGWIPIGNYTLSVVSNGKALYYTEFQLWQSTMVNIALIPDTVRGRILRPAEVSASRIKPVYDPIVSPDDTRLWNLNDNPALSDSGPASADLSWPGSSYSPRPGGIKHPLASGLASWRPRWLDEPIPRPDRVSNKKKSSNVENKKDK